MRKFLVATLLIAAAVPVAAQDGPDGAPPDRDPRQPIIRFLELSPSQVAAWGDLLAESTAAAEPFRTRLHEIQTELRELLTTDPADPLAIGELIIERRDLGESLNELHRGYVESFTAEILTEDQLQRFNAVRRAQRLQSVIPAFERFGLLPPSPRAPEPAAIAGPPQAQAR
jgi:hypothetical protein